ncbi:MAG: (2Fe-2S)-binding protein [Desulfobacterales bacterium]|jgi:aerobic-type carbon monoxide dehydrogenase small subunit (CoxS/CutS family)
MALGENQPKEKKHIALWVNGKKVQAEVESWITLAEFLREELQLTGTKVGCNRAECGSCTVILDGDPVYSCSMLAVEAAGTEILTVEGLENSGRLHPLQEAFIEHDALQCGYCTPGMLMALKALLDKNPRPKKDDVRRAIDGNFCRCGSYPNIISATLDTSMELLRRKGANDGEK